MLRTCHQSFSSVLRKCFKVGLPLHNQGALAKEHMENTQAAEQVRSARRKVQNRRQVQKGGVLYASEAHQMVKRREVQVVEVEKAEKQLCKAQNVKKKG